MPRDFCYPLQEAVIYQFSTNPASGFAGTMASSDSNNAAGWFGRAATWIHDNFLWLLVVSYLLAAVVPGPGLAIRGLSYTRATGDEVSAPLVLLAVLLFCAAAVIRGSQLRGLFERPWTLVLSLFAVWLVPAVFVILLGWLLGASISTGMMVGLALVAAMPVANSSVAWTQNAHGNVALGLGLIVLTIVLSPVAAPQMLKLMGLALSPEETVHSEVLVREFSGTFFIVWVILPSLAGLAFNRFAGRERIAALRGSIRLVSALTLLTLNYANAALAMPKLLESESMGAILFSALLALSISLLGVMSAWGVSRLWKLGQATWVSLVFAFSMKHTGLALVLAGEVLKDEPRAILIIVQATLLQHIVAAVVDHWLARHGYETAGAEAS